MCETQTDCVRDQIMRRTIQMRYLVSHQSSLTTSAREDRSPTLLYGSIHHTLRFDSKGPERLCR